MSCPNCDGLGSAPAQDENNDLRALAKTTQTYREDYLEAAYDHKGRPRPPLAETTWGYEYGGEDANTKEQFIIACSPERILNLLDQLQQLTKALAEMDQHESRHHPVCSSGPRYFDASDPKLYDKAFGDERVCMCTHQYYRHFDTYEQMRPVGCKYCECRVFVLSTSGEKA